MAGEVEDGVGLRAKYLPTGSISFGRFESEALSWERRSSFSHNRYLEEVERFSTPGSVTQKKAYFEAHFRKRGLLRQASCLSSSGSEGRGNDGESEDQANFTENVCENRCVEDAQCNELQDRENGRVGFSEREEDPVAAAEVVVHQSGGGEVEVALSSGSHCEEILHSSEKGLEPNTQIENYAEQDHASSEYNASCITVDTQVSVEHEPMNSLHEENLGKEVARNVDPQSETGDLSCMTASSKTADKGKRVAEQKTVKSKAKPQPLNAKRLQGPSTEKKLVRNHLKPGLNGPRQTKQEKQSPLMASSATPSISRFMKSEGSKDLKTRTLRTKSESDLRAQRVAITPKTISRGTATVASESSSSYCRPNRVTTSSKSELKSAAINSKSSEGGALKKEGATAKMNVSTNSPNFKATPLPAFYRAPVSTASIQCKTPEKSKKTAKGSTGSKAAPNLNTPARGATPHTPRASAKFNPSSMTHSPGSAITKTRSTRCDNITGTSETGSGIGKKDERSRIKLNSQPGNTNVRKDPVGSKVRSGSNGNIGKTKGSVKSESSTYHVAS